MIEMIYLCENIDILSNKKIKELKIVKKWINIYVV